MIAAAFPPTGGPGVQRTAKFAKYLPQFGWTPLVWTVDRLNGLPRDLSLLTDLPTDCVVHPGGFGRIGNLRRSISSTLADGNGRSPFLGAIASRLHRQTWHNPFPDDCASWARRSVGPLSHLIEHNGIDAIYSTFSPASNHVLALELKRRTGAVWIADFRDLWTDDYRYSQPSAVRRADERRLEQEILDAADVVIGVTKRQTAILASHVPTAPHKFVTITNGFDPADFVEFCSGSDSGPKPVDRDSRLVLAHVGRFDRWRAVDAWYAGLERFIRRIGPDRDRFVLRIVGHANDTTRRKLCATGARCEFTGYVPHTEAVGRMRRADALLLSVPDGANADSVIPAKLFEYLASGRPILVVGPEGGECDRIANECNAGLSVTFDAGAIAEALRRLYNAWQRGRSLSGCSANHLGAFSRIELTQRLASILDRLAGGKAHEDEDACQLVEASTG